MTFLSDNADEAIELWQQHVGPTLGKVALNQFVRATRNPSNLLVERVIKPNLFTGWARATGSYYPIAYDVYVPGRNHLLAESIAAAAGSLLEEAEWTAATYFANALRPTMPYVDPLGGEEEWEPPKNRICFAPHHVSTFEFDRSEITFLQEQLSWLRSSHKKLDCSMGEIYKSLSQYVDFAGITVVYAGNKSVHIHITFEMLLAVDRLNLTTVSNPRDGFVAHWLRLKEIVVAALKPSQQQEPDASLRFPEAYRRLPNGYRTIKGTNLLGFPEGTYVPQVTLLSSTEN